MSCFLHEKPQKNCKKCQKALALAAPKAAPAEETPKESAGPSDDKEDKGPDQAAAGSRVRVDFKMTSMLKGLICSSKYYKRLSDITGLDFLVSEMVESVDCIDVYNPGNWKISCSVSSNNSPTCFICHVVRLYDMSLGYSPNIDNKLDLLIDNRKHAFVRCVGFLYLRFVTPFADLINVLEEYLLDDMELTYNQAGATVTTTIGEYVESLLTEDKYFDSPLPRLPAKVKALVEEKVAPMLQYRKRMSANRKALTYDNVEDMPVEVCMDGQWGKGVARGFANRYPSRIKVKVELEGGVEVDVHLGKVIIDDAGDRRGDRDSHIDGRPRHRSRSRGRGHNRDTSPDWSRSKGKSDEELLRELRDRKVSSTQQAASGHSRSFAKKSQLVGETSQRTGARGRRYEDGDEEEEALEQARLERRRQEEQERQQKLASVYQKYGASAAPRNSSSTYNDVDSMDTLRFG